MAYGSLLPSVRVAGLERRARFAGEAFGHEELAVAAGGSASLVARLLWTGLALGALSIGIASWVFALN